MANRITGVRPRLGTKSKGIVSKASMPKTTNKAPKSAPSFTFTDNEASKPVDAVSKPPAFLRAAVDQVVGKVGLQPSSLLVPDRLSTGSLVIDYITHQLPLGCRLVVTGQEASAKTTLMSCIIASTLKNTGVNFRAIYDGEISFAPAYFEAIASSMIGLDLNITGLINDGSLFYSDDNSLTRASQALQYSVGQLPSKAWDNSNKSYYYMIEKDYARDYKVKVQDSVKKNGDPIYKSEQVAYKAEEVMEQLGVKADPKAATRTHHICYTDHRGAQAVVGWDSFPSFLPPGMDMDDYSKVEDLSKTLGQHARAYSSVLPAMIGDLRSKAAIFIGVNQVRTRPAVMYGDPTYEPCGEAIKFYTDIRLRMKAITNPHDKKEREEIEPSVEFPGNSDKYHYKHVKCTKNKFGPPLREADIRIWVSDGKGMARGICPVYDTYEYAKLIGAIEGKQNKFKLKLPDGQILDFTWPSFKKEILSNPGGGIRAKFFAEFAAKNAKGFGN